MEVESGRVEARAEVEVELFGLLLLLFSSVDIFSRFCLQQIFDHVIERENKVEKMNERFVLLSFFILFPFLAFSSRKSFQLISPAGSRRLDTMKYQEKTSLSSCLKVVKYFRDISESVPLDGHVGLTKL